MNDRHALVWPHLADLPAFRALIRAIEHRLLAEWQPFSPPVLDVGAGDGHFASVALGPHIDVGIDLKLTDLEEAHRRPVYRGVACASATAMPLPTNGFGTVVSNCVIEHIPDLPATLAEMHRVLRPGGRLLVTVPTDQLERNLQVPRALRALGLGGVATEYTHWFRRVQVHYHLLSRPDWIATFERAGFRVTHARGYMSARATRYFELGHYAGWDNLVARRLLGRWVWWRWQPRFLLLELLLASFVREPEHPDDSCLFLVAEKPES
jgi:SAM-dependent methyltransferase